MSRDPTRTSSTKLRVALVACVVAFAVQQTGIVPAVQDVQQDLHAGREWSAWLVTVYLMVATVATPALGRLADLYGRRRIMLVGLIVFAAASVGAAAAPDTVVLLVFRAVQGVGGAVYPLTLAVGREHSDGDMRGMVSLLAGAFGLGTVIGFVTGGALAQFASWRMVFVLGACLVTVATVAAVRWVPADEGPASGGFDAAGTALLAVASLALLAGLTLIASRGIGSPFSLVPLAIALAGTLVWVRHERHREDPLVDLHILADRRVLAANIATIALGWTMFASFLLVPEFAQTSPGRTGYGLAAGAFVVGLALLPQAIGQTITATAAGRLARVPPRVLFGAGMVLVAASQVLLLLTTRSFGALAVAMFLLGLGAGAGLHAASAVVTAAVNEDVAGESASLNSTVRRLAGGVGGQASAIALAVATLTPGGRPAFGGFVVSYAVAAALSLVGAATLLVHRRDRRPKRATHQT